MYELELLPVENEEKDGGKSGDAIAMRFSRDQGGTDAVMIVDGGFRTIGTDLVKHVEDYYDTSRVDLVVSTHPDQDHLNGLITVVEELTVVELLVHLPRNHCSSIRGFSNLEALDELVAVARRRRTKITEPFTGLTRIDGQVRVLGPSQDYYGELLDQQLRGSTAVKAAESSRAALWGRFDPLRRTRLRMPQETLTDEGETTERNNSSVVLLITVGGQRLLLTGDAGIPALERAADEYERVIGRFPSRPLHVFQAPHHGSRRNVGPTILNRILGKPNAPYGQPSAVISSAKAAPKHPSPKVINALTRRGCGVLATEGKAIGVFSGMDFPPGWGRLEPLPPLVEDGEE